MVNSTNDHPNTSRFESYFNHIVSAADTFSVTRDEIIRVICAIAFERRFGLTDERSHLLLVNLFCRSSGQIQELVHKLRQASRLPISEAIVLNSDKFSLTPLQFTNVIHNVFRLGYSRLPFTISKETLDVICSHSRLMSYDNCLTSDLCSVQLDGIDHLKAKSDGIIVAKASESSILASRDIASIIYDPVILCLVSVLLGGSPLIRHVSLWHSYPDSSPKDEAAQLFHFDLDEFRWYKLFIFLTDVTESSGPHVYIPGTHVPGVKPAELLRYGYSRIPDELIKRYHPQSSWRSITCEAGTMFLADTRCWHKGTVVTENMRSVLQPLYTLSKFSKILS